MFLINEAFFAAAMGSINSAEINLVFDLVSPEKRRNALSVKHTFSGLFGFGATLVATPFLLFCKRLTFLFLAYIYMHSKCFHWFLSF